MRTQWFTEDSKRNILLPCHKTLITLSKRKRKEKGEAGKNVLKVS